MSRLIGEKDSRAGRGFYCAADLTLAVGTPDRAW
jgi:hypothetical protein